MVQVLLAGIFAMVRTLGALVGAPEKAETLAATLAARVETARAARVLEQGGEFAGPAEGAAFVEVIERLFPEAVARQKKLLLLLVPNGERKHPVEVLGALAPVLCVCLEYHLGVRLGGKCVALGLQFLTQLLFLL